MGNFGKDEINKKKAFRKMEISKGWMMM